MVRLRETQLQSPEIPIRITQSIITAFSDSASFEAIKNKWKEIRRFIYRSSSFKNLDTEALAVSKSL